VINQCLSNHNSRVITHYYTIRSDDPPPLEPPAIFRLAEIEVPTLIAVGSGDVPDILTQADLLHENIAGAQKAAIPDVAHVPNMERRTDFNRLVLDFLDAQSGSMPCVATDH